MFPVQYESIIVLIFSTANSDCETAGKISDFPAVTREKKRSAVRPGGNVCYNAGPGYPMSNACLCARRKAVAGAGTGGEESQ